MALKKVLQKKWSYTLYQDDDRKFILSVLCGGVGMYELNIPLSDEEGERVLEDEGFLNGLAESIRSNAVAYSGRSVKI
jgi:hypothetical protein